MGQYFIVVECEGKLAYQMPWANVGSIVWTDAGYNGIAYNGYCRPVPFHPPGRSSFAWFVSGQLQEVWMEEQ